jgi:DNA-binding NtrC family response regulator
MPRLLESGCTFLRWCNRRRFDHARSSAPSGTCRRSSPYPLTRIRPARRQAAAVAPALPGSFRSLAPSTLRNLSREYTAWVLIQTGGNKEQAAQILGVDLSTLYRWERARQD